MDKSYLSLAKPFLSGILGAAFFIICFHTFQSPSPKIASVNVNHLVNEHIKQRLNSTLSENELQRDNQQFIIKLEQALHRVAKRENVYLIVSEAIVSGPEDYTEKVKHQIGKSP